MTKAALNMMERIRIQSNKDINTEWQNKFAIRH